MNLALTSEKPQALGHYSTSGIPLCVCCVNVGIGKSGSSSSSSSCTQGNHQSHIQQDHLPSPNYNHKHHHTTTSKRQYVPYSSVLTLLHYTVPTAVVGVLCDGVCVATATMIKYT